MTDVCYKHDCRESNKDLSLSRKLSVTMLVILLCLAGMATASHPLALEAQVGDTVVLPCPSNDDSHRFQFWQLVDDIIVGPGNSLDRNKYKYEVLTGKLFIRAVSTEETGSYKCVSKALTGDAMHVQAVELVVRKDWEEEFETDHATNVFRVLVVLGVLFVLLVIVSALYIVYASQRAINRITKLNDEESEEGPSTRRTYNPTTVPSTSTARYTNQDVHGIDNPVLDTDFPTAFKTLDSSVM